MSPELLLKILVPAFAILFGGVAVTLTWWRLDFIKHCKLALGTISDIQIKHSISPRAKNPQLQTKTFVEITFTTKQGQDRKVLHQPIWSHWVLAKTIGGKLDVWYDHKQPAIIFLRGEIWFFPIVFGLIAVLCGLASFAIFRDALFASGPSLHIAF